MAALRLIYGHRGTMIPPHPRIDEDCKKRSGKVDKEGSDLLLKKLFFLPLPSPHSSLILHCCRRWGKKGKERRVVIPPIQRFPP